MSFSSQSVQNYLIHDTKVENFFLSEYMTKAPGDYVKAYLLGLMYAESGLELGNADICKEIGLSAPELDECWEYWEAQGLILRHRAPGSTEYDIEFLSSKELYYGGRIPRQTASPAALEDGALRELLSEVESRTARLLSRKDIDEISSWLSSYGMSPEFVLSGYDYCASRNKSTDCKYVGKVLKDWKAKGLSSARDVKEHLASQDRHYALYKRVFRALGFSRGATEEEKRIMNSWADDMGFDEERILEACAKTSGISNPNINYVNSILRSWHAEKTRPRTEADYIAAVNTLYEADRARNAELSEKNRAKIMSEIPELAEVNEEMKDAGFRMSRANFMGESGKAVIAREDARRKRLLSRRAELLAAHGYLPDALDAIYTCRRCKDTGVLADGSRCPCYDQKLALVRENIGGNE